MRFVPLDALRGLAACGVMLFHISCLLLLPQHSLIQRVMWVVGKLGSAGVDVFFVISGICITLVYRRATRFETGSFWKRRWIRLWPTFAVSALVFGLMNGFQGPVNVVAAARNILANLIMLPGFPIWEQGGSAGVHWIVPLYWTLFFEAQFYLVFPLLAACWKRFGWWPTHYVALILSVAIYLADPSSTFFLVRYFQFLMGCQLCDFFHPRNASGRFAWGHLGLSNMIIAFAAFRGFRWEATLLAEMLVLLAVAAGRWRGTARVEAWLASIGKFSYTLYLYHGPLVWITFKLVILLSLSPMFHALIFIPAALALSLGGSWLMFHLVEKHFL